MIRRFELIAITVLWLGLPGNSVFGQELPPPPTTLTIDVENVVEYQGDISDPTKFGTSPGITPSNGISAFAVVVAIGDIVSVNGQPAKGVYVGRPLDIALSPTPRPRQSIADVAHASLRSHTFEILKPDGTPIGTIMSFGLDGGTPPPGPHLMRSPPGAITRSMAAQEHISERVGNLSSASRRSRQYHPARHPWPRTPRTGVSTEAERFSSCFTFFPDTRHKSQSLPTPAISLS
jgi:hypothetical protein